MGNDSWERHSRERKAAISAASENMTQLSDALRLIETKSVDGSPHIQDAFTLLANLASNVEKLSYFESQYEVPKVEEVSKLPPSMLSKMSESTIMSNDFLDGIQHRFMTRGGELRLISRTIPSDG